MIWEMNRALRPTACHMYASKDFSPPPGRSLAQYPRRYRSRAIVYEL